MPVDEYRIVATLFDGFLQIVCFRASIKSDSAVRVKEKMKIGELSRRCAVSVRMLRYYEAQGLLQPRRTSSGYRDFSAVDEQTVERIKLLGSGGMTLATFKQFAPCIRGEDPVFEPCDELRAALDALLRSVDQQAEKLCTTRSVLEKFRHAVG